MTWKEIVEKLALFIDMCSVFCNRCPAHEYCNRHSELGSCSKVIMEWARVEVEGEDK